MTGDTCVLLLAFVPTVTSVIYLLIQENWRDRLFQELREEIEATKAASRRRQREHDAFMHKIAMRDFDEGRCGCDGCGREEHGHE